MKQFRGLWRLLPSTAKSRTRISTRFVASNGDVREEFERLMLEIDYWRAVLREHMRENGFSRFPIPDIDGEFHSVIGCFPLRAATFRDSATAEFGLRGFGQHLVPPVKGEASLLLTAAESLPQPASRCHQRASGSSQKT